MLDALRDAYSTLDALIMSAAVADFSVEAPAATRSNAAARRSTCSSSPTRTCWRKRRRSHRSDAWCASVSR